MAHSLRFVDLFAGLGGFHVALQRLGHQCVFASELDKTLRHTYEKNFGLRPEGDIRKVNVVSIPRHELLCAGFPCQPFSKAGEQQGLECPSHGDLFSYVIKVLRHHQPRYFILENVPNLLRHDEGGTYSLMKAKLESAGYEVKEALFSPHHFGIPQVRERAYIVGRLSKLRDFEWPKKKGGAKTSIEWALDKSPSDAKPLSNVSIEVIQAWQQFIDLFPADKELPSFPIWSAEFGADYPYEDETPHVAGLRRLARCKGTHGAPLGDLRCEERMLGLPSYAQVKKKKFPKWKIAFIRQNRQLYAENKRWIDRWLPRIAEFHPSHQKLEWNCKGEARDIWRYVLQFRASGLRVKRPTTAPSLIAMTTTQVPIIGWERRYMTPRECAKLQSLDALLTLPASSARAYKALGNAVNADVVEMIARSLLVEKGEPQRSVHKREGIEQGALT